MRGAVGKRKEGVVVVKPIIVGSYALQLATAEVGSRGLANKTQKATHKWSVILRAADNENQSYYIRKVIFLLHPSFTYHTRTVDAPPFEIHECGWGEFDIRAKIYFTDSSEKPVDVQHTVRLYPMPQDDKTCVMRQPTPDMAPCLAAETHDDLLFHDPTQNFYDALIAGPTKPPLTYALSPYFLDRNEILAKAMEATAAAHTAVQIEIQAAQEEITRLAKEVESAKELYYHANQEEAAAAAGVVRAAGSAAEAPSSRRREI